MSDLTVVIATVFKPPTLPALVASCAQHGVPCLVVEGQRTNAAWSEGLAKSDTRYIAIFNDDIALAPRDEWPDRLMRHFDEGDSYVALTMGRALAGLYSRPLNETMFAVSSVHCRAEPMHKGHAFAFDRTVFDDPIPQALSIYYGDDWFYWNHAARGRCCLPLDMAFMTGMDVPMLGVSEVSGWTGAQPGFNAFLGEPLQGIADRDREAARRIFRMAANNATPVGLAEPVVA